MNKHNKSESFLDRHSTLITTTFVWTLVLGVVFILRSFFLLMFLTFVFAYIQSQAVERLASKIKNRTSRVVLVGIGFVVAIVVLFNFLIPQVRDQAKIFAGNSGKYLKSFDDALYRYSLNHPTIDVLVPELKDYDPTAVSWDAKHSPTASLLQPLLGFSNEDSNVGSGSTTLKKTVNQIKDIGGKILAISSSFLFSILLSFLIVLDLPRLTLGAQSLARTKVGFIYEEAAFSIFSFCRTLGKAFEAQFFIALLNTILTALGMILIGIKGEILFLSMIVFFCSFIPIAGVVISSVPICLLALEQGGVSLMLLSIGLITIIHIVEAYVLNPRIFGQHLRMNPVIVLIILTVGGKLFGIWGLVLGLPICTYIVRDAIQYKSKDNLDHVS